MKKIIIGLCLLLAAQWAGAQTVLVVDAQTNEPLEWVAILGVPSQQLVSTNAIGQAEIKIFPASDSLTFSKIGYQSIKMALKDVRAQQTIKLTATRLNLNEVVISATRWQQSSGNLPLKIATIAPKQVQLQNPQTAADLLGISGKVFIQKSQQGGGSPMIRGFATNRLIYSIDGIRMNTAIFRGGNIQNVINLDPFAVENTEVLFGPNSVIYGSDAVGGVMSFQTLVPEFTLDNQPLIIGKAISRYSSANGEKTGHFDVNIGWKKWAMVTSFSHWDFGNLRQGSNGPDDYLKPYYVQRQDSTDHVIAQSDPLLQIPTAYTQTNFMQKIRFAPSAKWDFQYALHYSTTSKYGRYDRHNRTRNGLPRYAEWDYGPQKWMMNNFIAAYQSPNRFFNKMTLRLARQDFEESRIDRALNSTTRTTQTEQVVAYSANLDFLKPLGSRQTLYYGLEWVTNSVTSLGETQNIATLVKMDAASRYPQATWQTAGAYISTEYALGKRVTISAGGRYTAYALNADFSQNAPYFPFDFSQAKLQNSAVTGSLGAVFRPSDTWIASLNVGTAFRAPNVDDIGKIFDSEPGAVTLPNPNLSAEYAYNLDISLAKVFQKTLKIDLTAYYTRLSNAIVRRNATLNGADSILYAGELSQVQMLQNAAVAQVFGLQAGIELKLPAGFGFSTDLNWQQGEEELDDGTVSPSRHAAPFFGVSRFTYTARKLTLQFYSHFQGARSFSQLAVEEQGKDEIYAKDSNGNNYAPAWYTLNIKAMYALTPNISLSTGLENITDQRYRPYSSGISGAGRNFIMALRASF